MKSSSCSACASFLRTGNTKWSPLCLVRMLNDAGRIPDMIIADYRLRAGKTGLEAIRDIHKACNSDIPAVVLTGDTAPERIAEVRGSGFRLIHKPVTTATLRDILASVA